MAYLKKQGDNEAQGYSYARAEDVFRRVNAALSARGVAVIGSQVTLERYELVPDPAGKKRPQVQAVVRIQQTYGNGTETATFQGMGSGADVGDKAVMKANTAALKYLLTGMFNISWGDDPEATDPETGETTGQKASKAPKKANSLSRKPAKSSGELEAIKTALAAKDLTLEDLKSVIKPQIQQLTPGTPEYQEAVKLYKETQTRIGQLPLPTAN